MTEWYQEALNRLSEAVGRVNARKDSGNMSFLIQALYVLKKDVRNRGRSKDFYFISLIPVYTGQQVIGGNWKRAEIDLPTMTYLDALEVARAEEIANERSAGNYDQSLGAFAWSCKADAILAARHIATWINKERDRRQATTFERVNVYVSVDEYDDFVALKQRLADEAAANVDIETGQALI